MENLDPRELLGHLSSAVGHQVINAFSTIVSQGEILRTLTGSSHESRADIDERVDTIIRTALDAALMTRRMIEFSHEAIAIDPDRPGKGVEEIHLDRLLSELADAEREHLGSSVSLVLDLAPMPAIRGHPRALRHMFNFLIQNAAESLAGRSGTVTVRAIVEPRDWIVVEIRDDGCGITDDVMEHAAEPFFSTKPGHRGIGLTIARGIWRRHRGTMAIESEPGQGTVVRLTVAVPVSR